MNKETLSFVTPPPKNYKISSAFSYNFKLALTDAGQTASMRAQPALSALVAPVTGSESGSPVSIQISFNIQGNATPETVASLQEFGDDFAQRVQDVVSGMLADRERRRMA